MIGHKALGGSASLALLGAISVIIYSGVTMQRENEGGVHEILANVVLVLIALHVVAVVAMSLITRDNLIRAFITGRKRAALHPGVPDARPPATLAVPLAVVAIGASTYGALALDPLAFTPGAHAEPGERGEGAAAKGEHDDD